MSTDRTQPPRIWVYGAGFVLLTTCGATAAEVDFRPSLSFGVFHNGNLAVTGEGGGGDDGASLDIDLTVDRRTANSLFTFTYRPAYEAYRESKDLDFFSNTISLGYSRDGARASRFYIDGYATRTDYQGPTFQTADVATTFVPRTTVTRGNARIGGSIPAGKRGFFDLQLRGTVDFYDDLADNPATDVVGDPIFFNDVSAGIGKVAWRTEITSRNSIGLGLEGSYFDYELTEDVMIGTLGIVGTSQPGEYWLINYLVGGSYAETDTDSISGFSFDLSVTYTAVRESTFGGGARQAFAPGTGIGAATQDRGLWVSYAHLPTARGLSGSLLGGYWQREELSFGATSASASTSPSTDSFNLNGSLGWKFNRFITLGADYAFVDQKTDAPAASSLETSYSSYGISLNWAIRGR